MNAEGCLTIMSNRQVVAVAAVHTTLKVSEYPSVRGISVWEMAEMLWKGCRASKRLKVTTFHVIIDQLKSALEKRIEAYSLVLQIFGVLTEYASTSDEDIDVTNAITELVGMYSKDLSSDFSAKFRQCICWIKE